MYLSLNEPMTRLSEGVGSGIDDMKGPLSPMVLEMLTGWGSSLRF